MTIINFMKTQNHYSVIELPNIDGTIFNSKAIEGKPFMISFFRFASCPFCNMRVNELVKLFDEFENDFTIIAIFDSSIDNLQKHSLKHKAPFPILADEKNIYYKEYAIKKSFYGMLKGMITRFPTLMKGIFKGYIPISPKGSMITMPAEFLVDKNGIIQNIYYGKDEGDHIDFEIVKEFSKNN